MKILPTILLMASIAIALTVIPDANAKGGGGHHCIIATNGTVLSCVGTKVCSDRCGYQEQTHTGTDAYNYLNHTSNNSQPTDFVYVTSTHPVYHPSDFIVMYGIAKNNLDNPQNTPLSLNITRPDGTLLVSNSVNLDPTGAFVQYVAGSKLNGIGAYIITAGFGTTSTSTVFFLEN